MSKTRLIYIDNLRIVLTALVVLHHLAITYGAPGGWYYEESEAGFPAIVPLSMFVATNQAFFMGMFFFISAFFIVPSLERKGTGKFIADRLLRLGLPTLLFYFLISPFTVYIRDVFILKYDHSFGEFWRNGWGFNFGPMWFVEALLIFTAAYLLIFSRGKKITMKFPGTGKIVIVVLLISFGQFLIRIWMPVGESFAGTNMQLSHFLQYIFLFSFGIVAWRNKWMDEINAKQGRRWFIAAQALIFIGFPVIFVAGGAVNGNIEVFMGGLHWQCFVYTLWEQLVGFALIYALLGIFKKHFNYQGRFAMKLSASAYGVYIIHTTVLVVISALALNIHIPQFMKFVVLSPIALLVCFSFAWFLKQIPGVKKVL